MKSYEKKVSSTKKSLEHLGDRYNAYFNFQIPVSNPIVDMSSFSMADMHKFKKQNLKHLWIIFCVYVFYQTRGISILFCVSFSISGSALPTIWGSNLEKYRLTLYYERSGSSVTSEGLTIGPVGNSSMD